MNYPDVKIATIPELDPHLVIPYWLECNLKNICSVTQKLGPAAWGNWHAAISTMHPTAAQVQCRLLYLPRTLSKYLDKN